MAAPAARGAESLVVSPLAERTLREGSPCPWPAGAAAPGRSRTHAVRYVSSVRRRGTRPALARPSGDKHHRSGSGDDAYHALDTIERLLGTVSAPQDAELAKVKGDLLRQKWGEQARRRARRAGAEASSRIEGDPAGGLPPWGEVITPLRRWATSCRLWVRRRPVAGVALREGSSEYKDPGEFYRRRQRVGWD